MVNLNRLPSRSTSLFILGLLVVSWVIPSGVQAQSIANPAQRILRQNTLNRSTVSPYLNLITNGNESSIARYQTFVRPQIESRRAAARTQNDITRLQRDLSQFNQQVSPVVSQALNDRPMMQQPVFQTGHPSYYGVYSHFYPGLGR